MLTTGSNSDGFIFSESSFGKSILRGNFNFPPAETLPNCEEGTEKIHYFVAADNAFPNRHNILTPFCGRNKDFIASNVAQVTYNYRLSRGRRVIENAFGKKSFNFVYCMFSIINQLLNAFQQGF